MNYLIVLLLAVVGALNYYLWYDENSGKMLVVSLQQQIAKKTQDNEALILRNDSLKAEVNSLRSDLDALEERARAEMGMIHKDETFFHILGSQQQPPTFNAAPIAEKPVIPVKSAAKMAPTKMAPTKVTPAKKPKKAKSTKPKTR